MTTPRRAVIPSFAFSSAKANLSSLVTSVVHDHAPHLIERHRGKETALLLNPDDLRAILETHPIRAQASVEAGEFAVSVPEWGVAGFGETLDAATDELLEQMRSYATDYLGRLAFYLATNRREHAPAVMRFALTPEDEQRQLLLDDSRRTAPVIEDSAQLAYAGQ